MCDKIAVTEGSYNDYYPGTAVDYHADLHTVPPLCTALYFKYIYTFKYYFIFDISDVRDEGHSRLTRTARHESESPGDRS